MITSRRWRPIVSFRPMRKSIQLLLTVGVEGEDEAAHDFARRAIAASAMR